MQWYLDCIMASKSERLFNIQALTNNFLVVNLSEVGAALICISRSRPRMLLHVVDERYGHGSDFRSGYTGKIHDRDSDSENSAEPETYAPRSGPEAWICSGFHYGVVGPKQT